MSLSEKQQTKVDSKLIKSAGIGNLPMVKKYLAKGANIHAQYDEPFHKACENEHLDVAGYLLDNGADIDAYDGLAFTNAIINGKVRVVEFLVEKGVEVTLFHCRMAKDNGHLAITEYLEAQMRKQRQHELDDKLIKGAGVGNLPMVKKYLAKGANIHAQQDEPFHKACENEQLDVAGYLLENGADIDAHNRYALQRAIVNKKPAIVKFLVEKGAEISDMHIIRAKTSMGLSMVEYLDAQMRKQTPGAEDTNDDKKRQHELDDELIKAAGVGFLSVVKECLRKGADIHVDVDEPFHKACENGNLTVVEYLLDNGADINACDGHALTHAIHKDQPDIVKFLVEKGAEISDLHILRAQNNMGHLMVQYLEAQMRKQTAAAEDTNDDDDEDKKAIMNGKLITAARDGDLSMVRISLHNGANIHVDDDEAFNLACKNGHSKVVEYLIKEGVDPNACIFDAIACAVHSGNFDIVKLLVEKGTRISDFDLSYAKSNKCFHILEYLEAQMRKQTPAAEDTNDDKKRQHELDDKLIEAATVGDLKKVKKYHRKGANIRADNDEALYEACAGDQLEVIKYLVDNGADIHSSYGYALSCAIKDGSLGAVKFLVEKGAEITPLDIACARNNADRPVLEYLLAKKQPPQARSANEDNAQKRYFQHLVYDSILIDGEILTEEESDDNKHARKRVRLAVSNFARTVQECTPVTVEFTL